MTVRRAVPNAASVSSSTRRGTARQSQYDARVDRRTPSPDAVAWFRYCLRVLLRCIALASFGVAAALAIPLALQLLFVFAAAGNAPSQAGTFALVMSAAVVVGAATPGLLLMWHERRITRWLAPMPKPECPECGYFLRADTVRCPECGLSLAARRGEQPEP
jgi:hypothetical protein